MWLVVILRCSNHETWSDNALDIIQICVKTTYVSLHFYVESYGISMVDAWFGDLVLIYVIYD